MTIEFDVEPTNQPNPGNLPAGQAAEIKFPPGTRQVYAYAFDALNPNFNDEITVSLPSDSGLCRHLVWDGFELIDEGTVNAPRLALGILTGKIQVQLTSPGRSAGARRN